MNSEQFTGHTIPRTVTQGILKVANSAGGRALIATQMHASVFNVETATCREPCPPCDDIIYVTALPSTAATTPGANVQFSMTATDSDGANYNVTNSATWSSQNTGIASITGAALATGQGCRLYNTFKVTTSTRATAQRVLCAAIRFLLARNSLNPQQPISVIGSKALTLVLFNCSDTATTETIPAGWSDMKPNGCTLDETIPYIPTAGTCVVNPRGTNREYKYRQRGKSCTISGDSTGVADFACTGFIDTGGYVTVCISQ